jgi:hypothetical protein
MICEYGALVKSYRERERERERERGKFSENILLYFQYTHHKSTNTIWTGLGLNRTCAVRDRRLNNKP